MVRNDFTKGMVRDAYDYYFERRDYAMENVVWPQVCDVRDVTGVNTAYEQSTSVIGSGQFAKVGERESIPEESILEGFTTLAKYQKFAKKIPFSEESVDDHSKIQNILKETVMGWADAEQWTLEQFFSSFFNKGGFTAGDPIFNQAITGILADSSGDFIYDTKPWFALAANEHVSKGGTSYLNSLGLPATPKNVEDAWIRLKAKNNRNERDEIINLGSNYGIVCAGELEPTINRIVKTEGLPGTDQNDVNVLLNRFQIFPWINISTITSWYLIILKKAIRAYKRKNLKIDFYYDEDTETYWVKGSFRYGTMIQNFRFAVAGQTPTA